MPDAQQIVDQSLVQAIAASPANRGLMQMIRTMWGPTIAQACAASSVPVSFLGALVANESGGNANAKRYERGVLSALWEVLLGRTAAFGSIHRDDLLGYICPPPAPILPGSAPGSFTAFSIGGPPLLPDSLQRLDDLATSWGLTQVMGYEAIAFHLDGVQRLQDPAGEFSVALQMLAQFADRFGLDLAADFAQMFDCWNTGRPHAPTADPQYIPKGLARMQLYGG